MSVRSWENFRRKLADHRQFILKRFNYAMERTKENEPPFKYSALSFSMSNIKFARPHRPSAEELAQGVLA